MNRPWCCPEPRCVPLHQLANDDLSAPAPGDTFSCFGQAPREVVFSYDGDEHKNDLRSCHYTPLKGLTAYQENEDDWRMLGRAYATAAKHAADARNPAKPEWAERYPKAGSSEGPDDG